MSENSFKSNSGTCSRMMWVEHIGWEVRSKGEPNFWVTVVGLVTARTQDDTAVRTTGLDSGRATQLPVRAAAPKTQIRSLYIQTF